MPHAMVGNTQSEQSPKNKDTSGIRWVKLFTQYLHFQWTGGGDENDLNKVWNIPEHLQTKEFWEIDDIDHQMHLYSLT